MKDSGSKADGINCVEIARDAMVLGKGDIPDKIPIRKRGYHRALKRGAMWAHLEKSSKEIMHDLCQSFYSNVIKDQILGISSLSKLLKSNE